MRVLALDAGMNLGWGALGGGRDVAAGSRRLDGNSTEMGRVMRSADGHVRAIILAQKPDLIGFAAPFVGQTWDPVRKRFNPISPQNIRPLFGVLAKIEEVCAELRIRCVEIDEPECRRAFLTAVPRKSRDIKLAVQRACRLRGWPAHDDHAADALCVASRLLEVFAPDQAHEMTPLFQAVHPADTDAVRVVARAVKATRKRGK